MQHSAAAPQNSSVSLSFSPPPSFYLSLLIRFSSLSPALYRTSAASSLHRKKLKTD
ncbi:hypothetical protein Csa_022136 [Cucumis sativus]|uniref:Uncharacterized protein n=1 Tax=Cucumis sativus TaxID=3659 RepID=A0A0A0LP61_CUCSA|nr:hypothetical protein Csa_022136 [Cucumis sativus]